MANWRDELKLEPYDPNAADGDGDGIVQDGTAWERPAGARLFDRAGQEVMPGRISETPVSDLIYKDQNGNTIRYTPKPRGGQREEKPGSKLGPTLGERSGNVGEGRSLGDRVTQRREREAALEQQRLQAEQAEAARQASEERRRQFAEVINNIPTRIEGDNDPFINLGNEGETATTATAKANFVYGFLAQALNAKADLADAEQTREEIAEKYPNVDLDNLDDQIEQLNAAAKALFGMNIEVPVDNRNARKNARLVQELNDAFGKSIRIQADVLNYVDDIETRNLNQTLENLPAEQLKQLDDTLQQYAGYFEAADTAEQTSFDYDNAPQVERQLRDQHYKFLSQNNTVDKIQRAQQKIRTARYNQLTRNRQTQQNFRQGTLDTLYPNIDIQPNHPVLGNLTENSPNPNNPLPQPTNNPLNIDAGLEDIDVDPNVERAIIVQTAVEHLRNGGSLADIPNDYWYDALSIASSDADIDTTNPFYRVKPSEGAVAQTTMFWRRNEDGTPSNQGYVTKIAEPAQSIAEHAAWNTAAALGIYPEGSNWGGYVDVEPSEANDWQETLPVIVTPIVWNHLPTNQNLSDLIQNRSYQTDYTGNGAAKRQLAAALHTYLVGDQDRNPGNTMSGYLDGETYIFPIDFGLSGGFIERPDFQEYITQGGRLNSNTNFLPALATYRETLTPEQRQQLDDELVDTYEAVLQRAEQLLENNTQQEFIEAMLPQNPWNYPDFNEDLARRELAAFYDGLQNAATKLRADQTNNLQLFLPQQN